MRPVDPHTSERFSAVVPGLCTCWRIIRKDGTELGFTDHDHDISFTGTLFSSISGAEGSSLEETSSLSTDNAEIVGVLDPALLGRSALEAGSFDKAEIQVWRVDWADPEARILLRTGHLGEVTCEGEGYRAEFRSLKHLLTQTGGRVYGRTCDAALGDTRCGIDLSDPAYRADGLVAGGDKRRLEVSVATQKTAGFYKDGTLMIADGPLTGLVRAIREHGAAGTGEVIQLWEALPQSLEAGTGVTLLAGCDKRFGTCRDKFSNQLNFQGFPYIPGNDILIRVARPGEGT